MADGSELRAAVRALGPALDRLAREVDQSQEFSVELWQLLARLGVAGLCFAPEVGGLGGSFEQFVQITEEIAYFGAGASLYCGPTVQVARAVVEHGSPAQIERLARPLIADGKVGAWSFTEPDTGSDPRSLRTTARRVDDGWLISGAKMFTSFAPMADVAIVFARTSERNVAAFAVQLPCEGWNPGRPIRMMSFGGQGTAPVQIDDMVVPDDALLGEEDSGFDILLGTESEGKIRAAAICCGIGRRALDEATHYALERTHRATPIGDKFPTIQALLGGMAANVEAALRTTEYAARQVDAGVAGVKKLAAISRIVAGRMAREVTSDAMQICGAYGITTDMVLERLYREGKFYEVAQGVIELQRIIVGKAQLAEGRG